MMNRLILFLCFVWMIPCSELLSVSWENVVLMWSAGGAKAKDIVCIGSMKMRTCQTVAQAGDLTSEIREVMKGKKAQVGVAVILNGKDTVTVNNDCRYPMLSVFKFHQALTVADSLQRNGLPLDAEIFIRKEELRQDTYSPLRDRYPEGGIVLPVKELLKYTLQLSDNNACDILFARSGGPQATDRYIRSLGGVRFAVVADENAMHKDLSLCYRNWTTPLEAAVLFQNLFTRRLFGKPYQDFLKRTLVEFETGKDRLIKPLENTGAVIGHKTGTGDLNAKGQIIGLNDVGFVCLPDGNYYAIAVFIKDSEENSHVTAQLIADISEAVYRYVVQNMSVK